MIYSKRPLYISRIAWSISLLLLSCMSVFAQVPANDLVCNATPLTVNSTCVFTQYTTANATNSSGLAVPCFTTIGPDVWFSIVVPANGILNFDSNTGFITDGVMALYSGTCSGTLTELYCDDDGSGSNGLMPSFNTLGLTPGTTVYLRFYEYGGGNDGTFSLCVSSPAPVAPPANDNPCAATPLTVGATCTFSQYTNANGTATAGVPAPGCANYTATTADVWFSAVVPANGILIFDSNIGVITDGGMAIYTGTCGGLTLLSCDDDLSANGNMPFINQTTGLTPGSTVYLRFWEFGGDISGTFSLCVSSPSAVAPPANDNPCAATPLTVGATCTFSQYTNANGTATAGVPAPGCANYTATTADVWFSAVVPANGSIIFDSNTGVITDGGMAVYTGTCGSLSLLSCDDDGSNNGFMPSISLNGLSPGTTVYIRIWENGGDNNGTFSLCASSGAECTSNGTNSSCATADPFCTGVSYDYCNTTDVPSLGSAGIYGCCFSTPNPAFFYMNVATTGPISFQISQQTFGGIGIDVDFVLWGPFASQASMCSGISASNIVDCNYSISAIETAVIPNAISGQWYMILITNYSNQPGLINFTQTNSGTAGAGTTNCNLITTLPSACSGGFYTLNGTVQVQGPPTTGTLTISNTCGGSVVLNAPFGTSIPFSLPNLCGNGANCTVTAAFSAPSAPVLLQTTYTAPSCNTLTALAGACSGGTYVLAGTLTTGCLPTTGTLTITSSCGGSVILNAPFSSPLNWTLPASSGNGGNCSITAVYSAAGAPIITPISIVEPSCCSANVGTFTVTQTNGTQTVSPNGDIQVILCPGGSVSLVSNNNFVLPPSTNPGFEVSELFYAIYRLPGPTVPDPDLDPNWTGYYWTGQDFNTANSVGLNTNNSGSCSPLLNLTGINATNNNLLFIPITADDGDNAPNFNGVVNHDQNNDGCFDIGNAYSVTFLNSVRFTALTSCNGTATVEIQGGYPEFFSGLYTITNTGNGTLSSTAVTSGGSANITGLTSGQTYSFSVYDGSGCSYSYSGTYSSGTPTASITPSTATITAGDCVNLIGTVSGNVPLANTTFNNPNCISIPDNGINPGNTGNTNNGTWASSVINVSGFCGTTWATGQTLIVKLNISHTFDTDLNIFLQAPNGVILTLSDDNGGAGDNYTNTQFSMTAGTSIAAGLSPFTGLFLPIGNFSAFNGTAINSIWRLWVGDDELGDAGILTNWEITFANQNTYSYSWAPTTGLSASNVLNPSACPAATTTYTLTATNSCGCSITASSTITVNAVVPPTATITAQTNVNCYGLATGSATVTAASGTPPYTYSWNTTLVQTTATATGLAAGTYTVIVTDATGQTATASVTITQPASPLQIYAHGINPTCSTICNGTSTVDVVGGTGPYSYLWNTGAITQSISALCAGTYTVTVTDANGCISSSSSTVPGCFQIQGILVNSCSTSEWNEEMVFFQVGSLPLNTSSLSVTWPTLANIWTGLCTNPAYIAAVNATITGGGVVLPMPVSGILPANANVVLITENVLNVPIADYSNLSGTLYMIFQCTGNTQGHFVNSGTTSNPLILNFGAGCSQPVTYVGNSLPNYNSSSDGGYVIYSSNGTPTYLNYGCSIPNTIQSNSVTLINSPPPVAPTVVNVNYCVGASASPLTASGTNLLWYTTATGGSGNAIAPTPSTASAGTFTYYVSQSVSSCESARSTITVTVGAAQTATISYAGSPFCKSLILAQSVALSGTTGGTYSSIAGLTINSSSGAIIPSTSTAGTYTVSYTIAASGGCSAFTATTSVQILAQPTVSAPASASICSGSNPNLALTSTPVGATFNWTYSGAATGSGTGTPINTILTNATCANTIVNYSITATISGCTGPAISVPVTVKPKPTSTFTLSSDTICINQNVILTFTGSSCPGNTFTSTFTSATINSGSGSGPYNLSWSSPGSYPLIFQASNTAGGCTASQYKDTVVVYALPIVSSSGSTTICSNQTTALTLSSTIVGTTYAWTVVQTGVTGASAGTGASITQTLTTTGALAGTAVYTVTPTANGCPGLPITITVTVNPLPVVSSSGITTICANQTTALSLSSTIVGTTYAWTVVQTGVSGASAGTGASIAQTITTTGAAAGTAVYTVTPTANGCPGLPTTITVTVNPLPVVSSSGSTTICANQTTALSLSSTIVGTTYAWTVVQTGVSGASAGTGASIAQFITTTGAIAGTAVYTVTPTANGCPGTPIAITVTVNPLPNAGTNGAITVCSNSTTVNLFNSLLNFPSTGGTWSGPSSLTGGSLGTFVPGTNTAGSYTYTLTSAGCPNTANVVVTVNPAAIVNAGSAQPVCSGGSVTLAGSISGGTTTGIWSAPSGTFSSVNSLTSAYTPSITSGTITLTLTSADPDVAGPCTVGTSTVVITVNQTPNVISSGTTTLCSSQTTALTLSSAVAGTSFSWTVVQSGVTGASNSSGSSIAQTLTNSGVVSGTAVYTVTSSANGCTGTPTPITVTVNPIPIASFLGTTPICSPASPAITLSSNLSGTTYAWTVVQTGVTGASSGSGISINQTLTASGTVNGTAVYTVTPTANLCAGTTLPITITVNPKPAASTLGGSYSICSGPTLATANSPSIQVLSNLGAGTTFAWSGSDGTSGTSNPISYAIPNNLCADQLITYSVTPTFNGCAGSAIIIPLTVHPNPIAAFTVSSSTICQNSTITVTVTGSACPTSSYFWTWPTGAIVSGSVAGPFTVTFPNSGNFNISLSLSNAGGFCLAQTAAVPITVNASATATAGSDINICSGTTINLSGIIGGGATSATWSAPSGTFSDVNSLTSTYTPSITTGVVQLTLVTNDPDGVGPCTSAVSTFNVTVNPAASISAGTASPVCSGNTIQLNGSVSGSASSGIWSAPSGTFNNATLPNAVYTPPTNASGNYVLIFTSNDPAGVCPAVSSTLTVTVNPAATVSIGAFNQNICSGTSINLPGSFGGGATSVTWSAPSGTFGDPNLAATTYAPSITSGTVIITLTANDPDGTGPCAAASTSRTITVTQRPNATISYPSSAYCQSETSDPLPIIVGTPGGTFTASPFSGLSMLPNNGQIIPSFSAPFTYVVTYTIPASGGCPIFTTTTQVAIYNQPPAPVIAPSTICAGIPQTIVASNGTWFSFSVNGVEVQAPSSNNTYITSALSLNSQVCVTSYPPSPLVFDGIMNESFWGVEWANSLGGPVPTGSFVGNNIDALYLLDRSGYLFGGIAGRVQNNSNNRVLMFLDTKAGGFNSLAGWTNRTNAPYYSIENLNSGITFDPGFAPDYILAMNQASGIAYFDLYDMQNNTNVFLGDDISSNFLGYTPNAGTGNYLEGFEFAIPFSAISNPVSSIKAFVMLVNDPGASATTTISNQFLTRANSGQLNYGNGAVNFGSAAPNPITYSLSPECSTQSCIVASASATTVTGFSYVSPLCQSASNPSPTFVSGYTPGGTFSANSINLSINSSTGLINLAASLPGTYVITYSIAASSCSPAGSSTFSFTINPSPTPVTGFTYTTPICKNGVNPIVVPASGFSSGGSYSYIAIPSGLSAGLSFNTSTGAINLAGSTPGTYTVTYSVAASGCRVAGNATFTITINPIPTTTSIFHD